MRQLLFSCGVCAIAGAQDGGRDYEAAFGGFLARHCFECHAGDEPEAGLDLRFADEAAARAEANDLLLVARRLRAGEMPPPERVRPGADELAAVLAWIAASGAEPEAARPALRRLNAREYANTVRDLFGVELDAAALFPAESPAHGFDTVAAGQALSPLLIERLLEAAESVAQAAIVLPEAPQRLGFAGDELDGPEHPGPALYAEGELVALARLPCAGEYRLRVRAFAQQAGPEVARLALCVDGVERERHDVAAVRGAPGEYAARVACEGGERRLGVRFLNDYWRPDDPDEERRDRNLFVEWLEIEGPLDLRPPTSFQSELFARFGPEHPDRERALLEHLATLVWRRPPGAEELARLVALGPDGAPLEEQAQLALQALLGSPQFLFRLEPDPPAAAAAQERALDGWELATRLAGCLWSSTPDAELLELARRGTLVDRDVLRAQVRRMLANPKAAALAEGFAAQWLQIERLERETVDAALFASMRGETLRFFAALLREERDVHELLTADFTFVDDALATHYGLAAQGEADAAGFRRASLAGTPRRGLLGQASVLTVTSEATRTSPPKRGKWILEALVGAPTPPPPPGAGNLDDAPEAGAPVSLRERLERHRADSACSACHARLDPLGFGLERFDAAGRWRDSEGGLPIDDRGVLPDGRAFAGPLELAALLRADGRFLEHLVRQLCVYALGRPLGPRDDATVAAVIAGLDPERPTLRAILEGLVLSSAFTTRVLEVP